MTIREQTEQIERTILNQRACLSVNSRGRQREEQEGEIRTCFQRDRDRIIHAKSFRRLKHKTQVFLAPKGDHYRTRLTHVLEVSQISRTIARALRLNEDLTEAIALGHDLGHTPFGHAGETVLRKIHPGGFDHYVQSLRVVDFIEKDGKGLNLTHEVRDGIIKHSKGKGSILPDNDATMAETLEGQVVRISDIIAYVNHDLDDALRAEVIKKTDIPENITAVIGDTHAKRINTMVTDLIYNTIARNLDSLSMSEQVLGAVYKLRAFLYERVYESDRLKSEFTKAKHILESLYGYYLENVDLITEHIPSETDAHNHTIARDFIACMTDRFALASYDKIFIPERWTDI
ncbi:deoxyguanosinetriphosphate triphosphohydrolase [Candidatus Magnetomonas plexicatena]|uniref:deoxyguanosinetriphosphate triphosphohydrolase n=1 Tax=Candidatus Magnetomonas plexicatena TaxID=2552947 RepID=UPI001C777EC2|nr:deoxyguanosinetriphosphate triphosphohydrolase [Nitrospirales bacterium LBB_01]